jgi:hypothetical protein
MAGHGEKLSGKQEQAIQALLACPTIKKAAEQVGVNESTLRGWLKRPVFAAAYREVRRQLLEGAAGHIQ